MYKVCYWVNEVACVNFCLRQKVLRTLRKHEELLSKTDFDADAVRESTTTASKRHIVIDSENVIGSNRQH